MTRLSLSSCARPTLTSRRISTYTVMGFTGYAVASLLGSVLAIHWQLTLGERLITCFAPPLAFIVVVTVASAVVGRERIVFYQTACAGVVAVAAAAAIAGTRVARPVDIATLGIGTFLVFGRLGCTAVACCHGTLGRGITYGRAHAAIGFWHRWVGRPLWPVQLLEAAASLVLVVVALASSSQAGRAAQVYISGYAAIRFALELRRGDSARPQLLGLSEGQWLAIITAAASAVWARDVFTVAVAAVVAAGAAGLVATRRRRELFAPQHLRLLDRAMTAASDGTRHETPLGVAVSRHDLADGRVDWVLSSSHPYWSEVSVRRLAHAMWPAWELVVGRTPGVMHVLVTSQHASSRMAV